MSSESQALYLNAIPLLAMASLYLATGAALVSELWRQRVRPRDLEFVLTLFFPCVGVAAGLIGALVLNDRDPIANPWATFGAILVASVPPIVFLLRWPDRTLVVGGARRVLEAEERSGAEHDRRETLKSFADDLGSARGTTEVGRLLTARVNASLGTEFACVWRVADSKANGLFALLRGEEQEWFAEAALDLRTEPSAVASVAFDAQSLVVHDAETSPLVNPRIGAIVKPRSGIFAPLASAGRVTAVLAAVAVGDRRRFTTDEVRLVEELCSEAALALEREHSSAALERALERERLVAAIARQVRAELDLRSVMTVAAQEIWTALGATRGIVRLSDEGGLDTVVTVWGGDGEAADDVPSSPVATLAAERRRTVAFADLAASELALSAGPVLEMGARAALATPVVVAGEVFGVLEAHRATAGDWSSEDVELAEAVCREIALAAQTARLLEENETRLRQQTALLEAAQVVTSELKPDVVLNRLVEEVGELIGAAAADFYILDPDRSVLRCAAVRGLPESVVGWEFASHRGLAGEALARGRALLSAERGRGVEPVSHEAYDGFAYAMVAPVTWGGEPRGVLGVGSRGGDRPFGARDLELLEAFAGLAALALRNAEAFEQRTRQARTQRGFFAIASALAEPLSLTATLEAVAQAATEALGGASAAVLMPEPDALSLVGAYALPEEVRRALETSSSDENATLLEAAGAGTILAAPALVEDDRFAPAWRRAAAEAGFVSLVAIPVGLREVERGAVLVFLAERRRLADDDIALARQLAGAAHGALERASLYEEERRSSALAQQLARTGSLLATELDPAAVVDEVVRRAPSLLGVEACVVRLLEGDELVVSAVEGEGAEDLLGTQTAASGRLSGQVVESEFPVAVADAAREATLRADDPLLERGYHAFLGVPLAGREGAMHGVLAVYARQPRRWRDDEVQALQALAGNASAAISNAELYQRVALANERNHAILSNIADGIVAVNRDGDVVLWNRAAEELTGVGASEALGRAPAEVLGRGLDADDEEPGDRLVRIVRGDEDIWLSVTEAVMRDPAGVVAGRIYAFRDISSDRLVEEMKSDFVAAVSQELRRPLTSIYGFAETLLRRDVLFGEDERRVFLEYIASESERLTAILDALLNVARLETGDVQVTLAPTDVGRLLSDAVAVVEPDGHRNGHRFVVDVPTEPVQAAADAEKLRVVVSNLLDNAVRYSPDGGTVTVAARRRGDAVEISVADEGVGIPAGEQDRIFRKFYRGDPRGSRAGGTGLGLFIARGLVDAMGGHITVSSHEGTGSRFVVELPGTAAPTLAAVAEE